MTEAAAPAAPAGGVLGRQLFGSVPGLASLLAFAILFGKPLGLLLREWWTSPEAGHGLLLAPVAIWLAWRTGIGPDRRERPGVGTAILLGAVLLRAVSELAAELFTMRFSMILALSGLIVFHWGWRQLLRWWLPVLLLLLALPLPELVTSALALPLQFRASRLGAMLLEWRNVPVRLSGNVIEIPGHRLFVTEACSGLRSLTALLSLTILTAGVWLRSWTSRIIIVAAAIPLAILINGVRVFLTGFLVYFVDPRLGQGFMHLTEGWLLFLVSMSAVGALTVIIRAIEQRARFRKRGAEGDLA